MTNLNRNPSVEDEYTHSVNNRVSQPHRGQDWYFHDRFLVNIRNTYSDTPKFEHCEIITAPLSIWGSDTWAWDPFRWSDMSQGEKLLCIDSLEWFLVNPHDRVSDMILIPISDPQSHVDDTFMEAENAYMQLEPDSFLVDDQHIEWLCEDYNVDDPEELIERGVFTYREALEDYILPIDCRPCYGIQRVKLSGADTSVIVEGLNSVIIEG